MELGNVSTRSIIFFRLGPLSEIHGLSRGPRFLPFSLRPIVADECHGPVFNDYRYHAYGRTHIKRNFHRAAVLGNASRGALHIMRIPGFFFPSVTSRRRVSPQFITPANLRYFFAFDSTRSETAVRSKPQSTKSA